MTDTDHVFRALLGSLAAVYGPASSDEKDNELMLKEYARLMAHYSETELAKAKDVILRTHKGPTRWPRIPDCIRAAADARDDQHLKNQTARYARRDEYPEWSDEAKRIADNLVNSDMGRRAATEGWILGLHDFCRKHRRLPGHNERHSKPEQGAAIAVMIETAKFIDDCVKHDAKLGVMTDALQGFVRDKMRKRQEMAKRVLGGAT